MGDKVLEGFRQRQFEEGMALAAASDLLELAPLEGSPPERYLARFAAKGLVRTAEGGISEAVGSMFGITLPDDYLRRADVTQVLAFLEPQEVYHPQIRPPLICVHIGPALPLVDLLYVCYELWTWNLRATHDGGLNKTASQWFRHQEPSRFPIDRRPLKRRTLNLQVDMQVEAGRP